MAEIDIQRLTRLTSSSDKKDRIAGQRLLKGLGLYSGPLDGNVGDGSTAAIAKLRKELNAKQERQSRLNEIKINAAAEARRAQAADKKRADEAKAQALKIKNDEKLATKKAYDAAAQVAFTATALGTSVVFANHEVNKLNKIDAGAVAAKNRELKRVSDQIDAIKSENGAKTKTKQLRASTKRRIAAVAGEARISGTTKFKMPLGAPSGVLLAGKGLLLQYAASKMSNEYARDGLNAAASGLYIAGLGVPAARLTRAKFGASPLNAKYLSKIADAEALGSATKSVKAAKSAKVAASAVGTKAVTKVATRIGASALGRAALRFAGPVGVAISVGLTARASYNAYVKTGSLVKAAEAGADELTLGGYSLAKKYATGGPKEPIKTSALTPKIRSLTGELKRAPGKSRNITPQKIASLTSTSQAPARRKRFITVRKKGGGTYQRKNPYYGKSVARG